MTPAPAKGCHGCRYTSGITCIAPQDVAVGTWQGRHLLPDLLTPKPGAPECPGRVPR